MKTIIRENTHLTRGGYIDFGWGNGYVIIPKGNKLYGLGYGDKAYDSIDVNGGLTYSEEVTHDRLEWFPELKDSIGHWMIGFDTCHCFDTLDKWSKQSVQNEADKLLRQLKSL